nr:probable protein phosphatase 2C 42 [Ipomoea batatas]
MDIQANIDGKFYNTKQQKKIDVIPNYGDLKTTSVQVEKLEVKNGGNVSPLKWNMSTSREWGSYSSSSNGAFGRDGLLWYHDVGRYGGGEFSMAVVQANRVLEDQSRIESGRFGTFVGVYDGHGGPEAARYVCDNLFRHLQAFNVGAAMSATEENGVVTADTIQRAFLETERGFTDLVSDKWNSQPHLATVGTCCLVGVISQQTLFIASLGDSRVVLGKKVGSTREIAAIPLSEEHNANIAAVRQELKALHPNDPQIVVLKHGVWRVKGIIQVLSLMQISRSIGDVYLKHQQFNRAPINAKFRLPEPIDMPILSATPSILTHPLHPNDSFLIFASDGLWEHLSNEKAVDIVKSNPHSGSAKRLIKAALQEAAKKREMRYSDLRKIDKKVRRHFHDDITVIVLFLNHDLISKGVVQDPPLSIRSALEH